MSEEMSDEEFWQWQNELYDAKFSLDVEKFREFHNKWKKMYEEELPADDYAVEILLRRLILISVEANRWQKEEAKRWLKERGLSEKI